MSATDKKFSNVLNASETLLWLWNKVFVLNIFPMLVMEKRELRHLSVVVWTLLDEEEKDG